MDFKTYQEAAKVTVNWLGTDQADLAHMALGMSSEFGELHQCLRGDNRHKIIDKVNLLEELGDKMWYIANWCNIRKLNLDDYTTVETIGFLSDPITAIIDCMEWFTDSAKRYLAYNQPIESQKRASKEDEMIKLYIRAINTIAVDFGLSLSNIMGKNILKLYNRYQGKFSEYATLTRDIEAERKILEA